MKYAFFTILAQFPEKGQDALNQFCAMHSINSIEKHFVENGENSYWSFCVSYVQQGSSSPRNGVKKNAIDYREVLSEADFAVYAKLRTLRKALAEKEGTPAYVIFTNEQLAKMVTTQVTSKQALSEIEGIGKGRVDKYADEFLNILQNAFSKS